MAKPRVTVGIATYNGAKYLPEQLDTIFAQTHKAIDVVAVDDGSRDETVEVLEGFSRRYPVQVFKNRKNLGLVACFEQVMRECYAGGSEFVALADQDDVWKPTKVETLLRNIGAASLIFNPAEWVLRPDGSLGRPDNFRAYVAYCARRGSGRRVPELLANNFVVGHQTLFSRDVIAAALPFPPGLRYHDHWVALTAAQLGGIKFHAADLMVYRQHAGSVTYAGAASRRFPKAGLHGWFTRHRHYLAEVQWQREQLAKWEQLPSFTPADRAIMARLRSVYQAQLTSGLHAVELIAALRLDPLFIWHTPMSRFRHYASTLFGTLLTSASPKDVVYA